MGFDVNFTAEVQLGMMSFEPGAASLCAVSAGMHSSNVLLQKAGCCVVVVSNSACASSG